MSEEVPSPKTRLDILKEVFDPLVDTRVFLVGGGLNVIFGFAGLFGFESGAFDPNMPTLNFLAGGLGLLMASRGHFMGDPDEC